MTSPVVLCAIESQQLGRRRRIWVFGCATLAPPASALQDEVWSGFFKLKVVSALVGSGRLDPTSDVVLRAVTARPKRRPLPESRRPSALRDTVTFTCVRCGQLNPVPVDPAGGQDQDLIEDCQTCCAPNRLRIALAPARMRYSVAVEEA
jgi:hypothetical protein